MDAYEREENEIIEAYNSGAITRKEMVKQLNDLQRDYRDAAQEAAERAYRDEWERW